MQADSPTFWYKVTVTTMHHNPASFEGALYGATVKGAADSLKALQKAWNVKTINTISIFKMEDGVISDEPELFINHLLERSTSPNIKHQTAAQESAKERRATHAAYNSADWCRELKVPISFTTVSIKETDA